jgi:glycosyltransferase involved in cell wall biosynthesis
VTFQASVAVLLCSFNGGRYLSPQLDSIAAQVAGDKRLYVSDDGSTDNTLELISNWRVANAALEVQVRPGPGRGHTANFLSLLCDAGIDADYFAYADQDDIWDADKLARALAALKGLEHSRPALYCGRTRSISAAGQPMGLSPLFSRPPGFANALIHNIAGGNTMVMNRAARDIMLQAGVADVVTHDWWTYLLIAGAGGEVIYDAKPCLSYRQHDDNAIGANVGPIKRMRRYLGFLEGNNRNWNRLNIAALEGCTHLLSPENRRLLACFKEMRQGGPAARLRALREGGFYAQSASANLGLRCATLLKKI